MFKVRLVVAKRIEEIKNDQGMAFTETLATCESVKGEPDILAKPIFTNIPAETIIIGISIAHMKPITDCLYLILISRHVSMYSISLYLINSSQQRIISQLF